MIKRYYSNIQELIEPGRVLVIYGPRQVGKTTLLQNFLSTTKKKYKLDSGDNIRTQQTLNSQDFSQIMEYIAGYELLAIDEAQNIPNIGMALKIIVDQRPDLFVIVTGSSSFDLSNQIGEPLTGRKRTITLFPIAQLELQQLYNQHELKENLEDFLIFGGYPDVVTASTRQKKITLLEELVDAYLLKDILALERVKGSKVLWDLVKLLAFQVGSEVSSSELGSQLGLDVKTVQRYIDLLEKSFVIFRLTGFSRNLRKEITKKHKYYFFDLGIRNAIIAQFNVLDQRNDIGSLWENFIVMERLKKRSYHNIYGNTYFWRTYSKQEIDLIEERDGMLYAYESKWSTKKALRPPALWLDTYPESTFNVITPKNYLDFVT